ncbi:hypothetical protein K435DRAFT_874314 [Dendrothele bispora CBS 962.96]|uniref:Uncharacterized protein n=1 Tax=Dendrothele bispora (strain CBS 962.96) TaxID=1314807 RepID=A0A4S8KX12_DENBC|nr:hypothetical protein K435DRAFT_874314 [Dendrothele bispora CBS 962.96]
MSKSRHVTKNKKGPTSKSVANPNPVASSSQSAANRKGAGKRPAEDNDIVDVHGSDSDNTTSQLQRPPAKKLKTKGTSGDGELGKAQAFQATFDDDATNENILEIQMANWKSEVYQHYKMPPAISGEGVFIKYTYSCNRCPNSVTR